jgi:hypothetical protein
MAAFDLRSVSGPITVALGCGFPQEEAFLGLRPVLRSAALKANEADE